MTPDTRRLAEELLESIKDFVNLSMPWREKRDLLLNGASPDERNALIELCSWFEPLPRE